MYVRVRQSYRRGRTEEEGEEEGKKELVLGMGGLWNRCKRKR